MAQKKVSGAGLSPRELRPWIEPDHQSLSVRRQCALLGLPRSSWYYQPRGETAENLALMRRIDEQYLRTPFYGSRKLARLLGVNRKRAQRLMRQMGIEAISRRRRTTRPGAGHRIYPYLLRNLEIVRPDQVWCSDITYIPVQHGFLYLVAVMDWFSRYVLSWRLSNTMEGSFCREALEAALARGRLRRSSSQLQPKFLNPGMRCPEGRSGKVGQLFPGLPPKAASGKSRWFRSDAESMLLEQRNVRHGVKTGLDQLPKQFAIHHCRAYN